jgi:hypothetical protein
LFKHSCPTYNEAVYATELTAPFGISVALKPVTTISSGTIIP